MPASTSELDPKIEPKQDRARATVAKILDNAGLLLEEVGVQGLTTNLIAERAGITVPALYRYFPNKFAVLKALGQRLLSQLGDVYEPLHRQGELHRHPMRSIELGFDRTLEIIHREPGAVAIMRALRAVPALEAVLVEAHERVSQWFADAIEILRPDLSAEHRWMIARMSVELSYACFEFALTDPRMDAETVVAELKRNLNAYWGTYGAGEETKNSGGARRRSKGRDRK